jgi:hypothetical protein
MIRPPARVTTGRHLTMVAMPAGALLDSAFVEIPDNVKPTGYGKGRMRDCGFRKRRGCVADAPYSTSMLARCAIVQILPDPGRIGMLRRTCTIVPRAVDTAVHRPVSFVLPKYGNR